MIIILDSNVLIADYHLRGAGFETLRRAAKRLNVQICIPAPVLEEVARNYKLELVKRWRESSESLERLSQFTKGILDIPSLPANPTDELAQEYRHRLVSQLEALGAIFQPYPMVKHADIMRRLAERRRPFKENGTGYADVLIWETVLECAINHADELIVLISQNVKDFADPSGGAFDSTLSEEIERVGLASSRVQFITSLNKFIEAHVSKKLASLDEIANGMNSGKHPYLALLQTAFPRRVTSFNSSLISAAQKHFRPARTDYFSIYARNPLTNIKVANVYQLNDAFIRVEFTGQTVIGFDFIVEKTGRGFESSVDVINSVTIDGWGELGGHATAGRGITASFSVVIDTKGNRVEAFTIDQIIHIAPVQVGRLAELDDSEAVDYEEVDTDDEYFFQQYFGESVDE